ncbi:acyltransferase [Paraburkholderia panacisoli]|uniref:Acyltransferase n=1 Tax=Paraburkholderia panacisoli TaxID=2603818 RepID=A0A5B0HFA1_9BURK|nr:acyltransferase [Paraburkholderia panacisoli]KAA1013553.1 acyltransferase [Paraburkholderia panacisoli]
MNNRYDALDGLRGVAAIAVMLGHFQTTLFQNAYVAVDLFFMLSGFVIAHSYRARLLGGMTGVEYIKRRFIRLYPMLLISLLIGLPVMIEAGALGISSYPMRSVVSATAYQFFFTPYIGSFVTAKAAVLSAFPAMDPSSGVLFPLNPPAWSLFYEMVASIAFVTLVRLNTGVMLKIIIVSGIMFLITGALVSFETHGRSIIDFQQGWGEDRIVGGFYQVAFGFVVGVFLYDVRNSNACRHILEAVPNWVFRHTYYLYAVALMVFVFPFAVRGLYPLLMIFCVAPCLVMVGANVSCAVPFEMKIARFLGWLSYPIYLLHFPIGRAVFMLVGKPNGSTAVPLLVSCAVTLLSAIVLTKYVEQPTRAFLSRKYARSSPTRGDPADQRSM